MLVIPRTFLPHQAHIIWARALQARHSSYLEGGFVANQNLRQQRLDLWPIAQEGDMCQASAPPSPRNPLHWPSFRWSFLAQENVAFHIALVQTNARLIHVEAQHFLARRRLRLYIIVSLPRSQRLRKKRKYISKRAGFRIGIRARFWSQK